MASPTVLSGIAGGNALNPVSGFVSGRQARISEDAYNKQQQQNDLLFQQKQQDRQTAIDEAQRQKALEPVREDMAVYLHARRVSPDAAQQVWTQLAPKYGISPNANPDVILPQIIQRNPGILGPASSKVLDEFFAPPKERQPISVAPGASLFDPTTGKRIFTAPDKGTATLQSASSPTTGVNGDQFLKTLEPQTAAQVKALAEGRMAFPSGLALKSDYWQKMLQNVAQYDPSFDAVNYNKRAQTAQAFAKGKQGDAARAINQTISHMGALSDAINNLNNMGGAATILNPIANAYGEMTGDTRQGIFRQKAQAVSSELRKVFAASGGGGLEELRQWERSLPLNASKDQQQAYLHSGLELLQGAIDALDNQYRSGMGKSIMDSSLISDKAKKTLQQLNDVGQSAPTSSIPQGWTVTPHG